MNNRHKKMISILLIELICTTQIACGNKPVRSNLNHAYFDPNYSYSVNVIDNTKISNIAGTNLQNFQDRVHITRNNKTEYLLHNQIQSINGVSNQSTGTHAFEGGLVGASILGTTLAIASIAHDGEDFCNDPGTPASCKITLGLLSCAIGGVIGGGIGAIIGLGIPKKSKIQFTPTIQPTTSGISGGANLQVNF